MHYQTMSCKIEEVETSAIIKFCWSGGLRTDTTLKTIDKLSDRFISEIFDDGEFSGDSGQVITLHKVPGLKAKRLILVGLGEKRRVNAESYRTGAGKVAALKGIKKYKSICFYFDDSENIEHIPAVPEGFLLGDFRLLDYKTGDGAMDKLKVDTIDFCISNYRKKAKLEKAVNRGTITAEGVILAKSLAMHPGNHLPPRKFASTVQSLGKKYKFKTTILDEKAIKAENMGALLAVSQGSQEPPRFSILQYDGGRPNVNPVVLVGKGVTFDAGGISLKPALDMGDMKGDMQGAAIVVAAVVSAARLNLPINLIGLIPMTENLPSGTAIKPGDIISSRKGKTIEIINTDAEGRLILADALDYVNNYKPQAVFDIATLTGAAQYILGPIGIPYVTNNRNAARQLNEASKRSGEKVWELPLWDEYTEKMKSPIADLKNSGGKEAGTLTASAFLKEFIGDWPWTHIDIAGVDVEKNGQPYIPRGASGIGLRLLVEMLSNWKKM